MKILIRNNILEHHSLGVLFYFERSFKLENLQLPTVNEVVVTGRKKRRLIDKQAKLWQRISEWTKASDIEFDDGQTAEEKLGGCSFSVRQDGVYVTYTVGGADTVTKKLGSVVKILALLEELESPSKSDSEEDICEAIRNLLTIWYQKGLSQSIGNDNVKMRYTYHNHVDKSGNVHNENNYYAAESGGCFTKKSYGQGTPIYKTCYHEIGYTEPSGHDESGNVTGWRYTIASVGTICDLGSWKKVTSSSEPGSTWSHRVITGYNNDGPFLGYGCNCSRNIGDIDKVEIIYYEPEED